MVKKKGNEEVVELTGNPALENDNIEFTCARIDEEFNVLSKAIVEFRCIKGEIDLTEIVGKPMNFSIPKNVKIKRTGRSFDGTCVYAKYLGTVGRQQYFSAEVRPWLWFLTQQTDSYIFQNLDAMAIIQKVLERHQLKGKIKQKTSKLEVREYCVQYRETDFDFINRLMEEEGLYYYFVNDGTEEKMYISDSASGGLSKELSGGSDFQYLGGDPESSCLSMQDSEQFVSNEVILEDWNYEKPSKAQILKTISSKGEGSNAKKGSKGSYSLYDYPGNFNDEKVGKKLAETRMGSKFVEKQKWLGVTKTSKLEVGKTFKLQKHKRKVANTEFLITKTSYYIICDVEAYFAGANNESITSEVVQQNSSIRTMLKNIEISHGEFGSVKNLSALLDTTFNSNETSIGTKYYCLFEAIPKKIDFFPKQLTSKPIIAGIQTAEVTGPKGEEIHTDKMGRVKVQFHWDREGKKDDKTSCWVRVMVPWSGKNFGMVHIPRIGQEVVVQFEEGNPDRPLVVGMLYNEAIKTPYSLPVNKTQSGLKTRSSKKGDGKTFNELMFEDKKDAELVRFQSERDYEQIIKNDAKITVGLEHKKNGDLETTVHGDIRETSKTGNHTFMVEKGNQNVLINQNQSILIEKGNQTTILKKGDMIIEIASGEGLVDANKKIKLVVGKSSITIDKKSITLVADTINLKAKKDIKNSATNVTVKAKANIKMSAASAKIDAKAKVDINAKAAINIAAKGQTKIEGAMTEVAGKGMVTIKGGMTMIN